MKLAASDYDGTLLRHGEISREDLEAIRAWRAEGHIFGLATGRDLNMTRCEVEKRKIPFDFLICNTGASIYDQDYIPLHLSALPARAAAEVLDHPAAQGSRYFLISRGGRTYINVWSCESWLAGLGLELTPIEEPEARRMVGIHQIGLEFDTVEEAREKAGQFNRDFGIYMTSHQSGICVDLVPAGVDKGTGLALLMELKGWQPEEVLTIGDSENDLSMLSQYHGFAIEGSREEVRLAARSVAKGPAQMLYPDGLA